MAKKMLPMVLSVIYFLTSTAKAQSRDQGSLETAAKDLSYLTQYVMSSAQPNADERDRVVRALRSIKAASHPIAADMLSLARDPLLRSIDLEPKMRWAQIEAIYVHGNYSHARYLLRHTVQACLACHASTPEKAGLSMPFVRPSAVLSDLERSEYLATMRRPREAILSYEEVLSQTAIRQTRPEAWENALAQLLAMTVIMRNDPHITLELISRLSEIGGYSSEQKEMLLAWRQAAKLWTREPRIKNRTSNELTLKMQELVIQADSASRLRPQHGIVDYLRVLNLVDEVAKNKQGTRRKTAAFRIGGETAEKLHASFYWLYPEVYYEACIRSLPNSTESFKCWQRFENFKSRERFTLWDREMAGALKELAR